MSHQHTQTHSSSTEPVPSIESIGALVFKEIAKERKVSDLHLASLKLLFDTQALNATSIVDSNGVSCFIGEESGRRVYQVRGAKGQTVYTVFPNHYCSCHSFFYDIVSKSEGTYCKHQIAALLSDALDRTRVQNVKEVFVAEILQDITK